jgi:hypothetical protein
MYYSEYRLGDVICISSDEEDSDTDEADDDAGYEEFFASTQNNRAEREGKHRQSGCKGSR